MWNAAVMAVLIAVAGIYATRSAQTVDVARQSQAASVAAEMAMYRNAVVDYFTANDFNSTTVSTTALKNGGYLKPWTRMSQQGTPLLWSNWRDANGIIYIYATSLPAQNLTGELARLAYNSVFFGLYDSSLPTLQSPVSGDTHIPISAISGKSIPNGAPVWIAMTK